MREQPGNLVAELCQARQFERAVGGLVAWLAAAGRQPAPEVLMIGLGGKAAVFVHGQRGENRGALIAAPHAGPRPTGLGPGGDVPIVHEDGRSEEHTSELQSLMRISYAVFCLKK